MKNKAPLSLMEQLIMLLVFTLSAALCLQIYVFSARISHYCEDKGYAATAVQNTAESIKLCRGDITRYPQLLGGCGDITQWQIGYDKNWKEVSLAQASYRIIVTPETASLPTLGQASVFAQTEAGNELFRVTVAWQEEEYE